MGREKNAENIPFLRSTQPKSTERVPVVELSGFSRPPCFSPVTMISSVPFHPVGRRSSSLSLRDRDRLFLLVFLFSLSSFSFSSASLYIATQKEKIQTTIKSRADESQDSVLIIETAMTAMTKPKMTSQQNCRMTRLSSGAILRYCSRRDSFFWGVFLFSSVSAISNVSNRAYLRGP